MNAGGKMIWDQPGGHSAEVARLRKRVSDLEAETARQQDEYRAACEELAAALDELSRRHAEDQGRTEVSISGLAGRVHDLERVVRVHNLDRAAEHDS